MPSAYSRCPSPLGWEGASRWAWPSCWAWPSRWVQPCQPSLPLQRCHEVVGCLPLQSPAQRAPPPHPEAYPIVGQLTFRLHVAHSLFQLSCRMVYLVTLPCGSEWVACRQLVQSVYQRQVQRAFQLEGRGQGVW